MKFRRNEWRQNIISLVVQSLNVNTSRWSNEKSSFSRVNSFLQVFFCYLLSIYYVLDSNSQIIYRPVGVSFVCFAIRQFFILLPLPLQRISYFYRMRKIFGRFCTASAFQSINHFRRSHDH